MDLLGRQNWAFFRRKPHGQGRVTTTDAPNLQCSSKPPYTHKQDMLLCLSPLVKKDKIRSLKTRRRKNKTKPELRNHHYGTIQYLQEQCKGRNEIPAVRLWFPLLPWEYFFFSAFVSPPTKQGCHLHNHFAKWLGGLAIICHMNRTMKVSRSVFNK